MGWSSSRFLKLVTVGPNIWSAEHLKVDEKTPFANVCACDYGRSGPSSLVVYYVAEILLYVAAHMTT